MAGSKRERKIICKPVPKAVLDACLKQQAHRPTPSTFEKNCWRILRVTPFPIPNPPSLFGWETKRGETDVIADKLNPKTPFWHERD